MISGPLELGVDIVAVIIVGIIVLVFHLIDRTGVIAAIFVGFSVLVLGGLNWFIVLFFFLLVAGLSTRYRYEWKMKLGAAEEKGGARTWKNVIANGAVVAVLAIFYGLTGLNIFAAGYLGAVSTSMADTLATELGLLNTDEPRLLTNLHLKVKAGTSGGVSFLGEVAALFGGSFIALVAFIGGSFDGLNVSQVLASTMLVGFLSCNFDSLLGATIQVAYKCKVCGKMTEKKIHCGQPTEYYKGIRFIDNNVVNFLSTLFGALIVILLFPLM